MRGKLTRGQQVAHATWLALGNCMVRFSLAVADDANNSHAIEVLKSVCHTSLPLEFLFAEVTPGLKVIWVAVVLDEPCWQA